MRLNFLITAALAALAGFGIVYLATQFLGGTANGAAQGKVAHFRLAGSPRLLAGTAFTGPDGEDVTLADFEGKTILVNLWATWCAPCVEELPQFDALQKELGARDDFEVVTISIDNDADKARAFLQDLGLSNLSFYHDPDSGLMRSLGITALPVTLIVDGETRERGRMLGPAEWNSEDAHALIGHFLGGAPGETADD